MRFFMCRFALKSLLMYYKGKVEFIEGTPVKNSDLNRVSANVASAFYLLGNQLAQVQYQNTQYKDVHYFDI